MFGYDQVSPVLLIMGTILLMHIRDEAFAICPTVQGIGDHTLRSTALSACRQCAIVADSERNQCSSTVPVELLIRNVQRLGCVIVGNPAWQVVVRLGRSRQRQ